MRLSDVLSKPPDSSFRQVSGFLKKKLAVGGQQSISIGNIGLNYYCKGCGDTRTFWSGDKLYCIGVNERQISIDCVLRCQCGSSVAVWFLIESYNDIIGLTTDVRIIKRREKLSNMVVPSKEQYGEYTGLLAKAMQAYRDGLGAGSTVYVRKILEKITEQTATAARISVTGRNGGKKPFKNLLEEVNRHHAIIPREFSENGYRLFGELSDAVHGDYEEELVLSKFEPLYRLVIGVIENVRNNGELLTAINSLGWNDNGGMNNDQT
jgi:hypothetical protein